MGLSYGAHSNLCVNQVRVVYQLPQMLSYHTALATMQGAHSTCAGTRCAVCLSYQTGQSRPPADVAVAGIIRGCLGYRTAACA